MRDMLSNYGSRQCGINQLTICYWPLAYSQLVFHWTGKVAPLILLNHSFRKLSLNWLGTEDSEKKKKIKLFCFFQIPSNFYYDGKKNSSYFAFYILMINSAGAQDPRNILAKFVGNHAPSLNNRSIIFLWDEVSLSSCVCNRI